MGPSCCRPLPVNLAAVPKRATWWSITASGSANSALVEIWIRRDNPSPYTLGQTMYNTGLYQFDVVIPAGVTGDFVPVTFTVDGINPGTQTLYTAIGN